VEIRDVAPGLWFWRPQNWQWRPGVDWEPSVTCTWVESGGVRLVLDALEPPAGAIEVWRRLDERPPAVAVVLKPDHLRDLDKIVRRYGCQAFGPERERFRGVVPVEAMPETVIQPVHPGDRLPGGIIACDDGRGRHVTPLWLPEQRALVFADALTERGGELRVWTTPLLEERALPALRALLDLPFEHVIISHGEPVHTRADYERALERPPWPS
jgi:glyoxylase-like metal-dependent hydrolase (beta-lactamase superfamily II)